MDWLSRGEPAGRGLYFHYSFPIDKKVLSARAYVSGLGYDELHINGQRVGDHVLDPGITAYNKRVLYSTYDLTSALKVASTASASSWVTAGTARPSFFSNSM